MGREEVRIKSMLAEGKISSGEAKKLIDALSAKHSEKRKEGKPEGTKKASNVILLGGIGVVIFFLIIIFLDSGRHENGNLLQNPSFENGEGKQVRSWTVSASGMAFLGSTEKEDFFIRDEKNSHEGNFSISIRNSGGRKRGQLSWRQRIKPISRGRKLRLSGYIKTNGVADDGAAALVLRGLLGLKNEAFSSTTEMSYKLTGTTDWTWVKVEAMVDQTIEELQVLCQIKGGGTIWCDDLELKEVE